MKTSIKKALLLTSMAFTLTVNAQQVPVLKGNFKSEKVEDLGNKTFGFRDFTFSKNKWELNFTLFLDEAMSIPVFTFKAIGSYKADGKSDKVNGASNAIFYFDKKFVTLKTDNADVIKGFGFANCNLTKDKETEITDSGCSFLVSKSVCGQEFDLIQLIDNKLYLGTRPADGNMCTIEKRPTSLGSPLILKK
jgi:hypothetical protein